MPELEIGYQPRNLKRWTMPDSYFGEHWPEYYSSGCGQSRDSDALERSNFTAMLDLIGGESETVTIVRESHWAVGWVEWIAINQDDGAALRAADEAQDRLADYPVLDESAWSDLEYTEAADFWDSLSPREKVRMAMGERARYHWLEKQPVWIYGRRSYGDFPDDEIGRALEESLRSI